MTDAAEPHAFWVEWLTDSGAAAGEVVDGLDWSTYGVVGAIVVALGVASRYAHLLGPMGALVGSLVEKGVHTFYPKYKQEAARKAKVMEDTAWTMVEAIETLPDTDETKALKKFIKNHTPDEFEALYARWKREHRQRKAAEES